MEQAFQQVAFDNWLAAMSRKAPPLVLVSRPRPGIADSPSQPVVTNGILAGTRSTEALSADRIYVDAAPEARIEALKWAPVTGCAMLLTLAREKSGYDAQTPGQPDGEQKFMTYIAQILTCPMFRKDIDDRIANGLGGDWHVVIDTIVGLYVGIPDKDRELLRASLWTVAQAASSNPSTVERMCTFFQSTIDASDDVTAFFYYLDVKMVTYIDRGGKNEPDRVRNQADMVLHRVKMHFDASQWAAQAAAVYAETQTSLDAWIASNSTPIGPLASGWHPR